MTLRLDSLNQVGPACRALNADKLGTTMPATGATRGGERTRAANVTTGSSEIEALTAALMAQAGFDMALVERQACLVPGRDYRSDFFYRPLGIVVECDGLVKQSKAAGHQTVKGISRDAEKANLHQLEGYIYLRFVGAQIRHEGAYVLACLRRAIESRST